MCGHFALEHKDEKKAQELERLGAYFAKHPQVAFDPLDAIRDLNDRHVVCKKLDGIDVQHGDQRVVQPPYFAAHTPEDVERLAKSMPFALPWIYKPFVADGVPESHDLAMIFSTDGLKDAALPFIVQPFVNHDAQILKAYVLGDTILQIRRPSLPNRAPDQVHIGPAFEPFGRISNAGEGKGECKVLPEDEKSVPELDATLLRRVVQELRSRLDIQLFGVDFIRSNQSGDYMIIDVNYLPGYYGVANVFEQLLSLMLKRVREAKQ